MAYPLQGPVFAEEVEEHLASAVVAYTGFTEPDSSEEFNEAFWPLLTDSEYTIADAVAGALAELLDAHGAGWMVSHSLWESAGPPPVPAVVAIGSGSGSPISPAF